MDRKKLDRTDYHVVWICPMVTVEPLPSRFILDEEHDTPLYETADDDNIYIFSVMAGRNPAGVLAIWAGP